eukprot:gnl/MRDRNA2_/MRDRNA2_240599_c0_seq1.p1 gnl/MRDRNA2_/MRDRNA2_240599_c0~~gnl/MRDRNA2_/MRDRNA2_240599_c0_seq1.p1  ORF type:complete len:242 (+),score=27.24 gnl/MRDRNA2_/MRDRNA2_240599_c0_seq1:41-727(+)
MDQVPCFDAQSASKEILSEIKSTYENVLVDYKYLSRKELERIVQQCQGIFDRSLWRGPPPSCFYFEEMSRIWWLGRAWFYSTPYIYYWDYPEDLSKKLDSWSWEDTLEHRRKIQRHLSDTLESVKAKIKERLFAIAWMLDKTNDDIDSERSWNQTEITAWVKSTSKLLNEAPDNRDILQIFQEQWDSAKEMMYPIKQEHIIQQILTEICELREISHQDCKPEKFLTSS